MKNDREFMDDIWEKISKMETMEESKPARIRVPSRRQAIVSTAVVLIVITAFCLAISGIRIPPILAKNGVLYLLAFLVVVLAFYIDSRFQTKDSERGFEAGGQI